MSISPASHAPHPVGQRFEWSGDRGAQHQRNDQQEQKTAANDDPGDRQHEGVQVAPKGQQVIFQQGGCTRAGEATKSAGSSMPAGSSCSGSPRPATTPRSEGVESELYRMGCRQTIVGELKASIRVQDGLEGVTSPTGRPAGGSR